MYVGKWSRRLFAQSLGALSIAGGLGAARPAQAETAAGVWSSIELVGTQGGTMTLGQVAAPLVLIHLWGSWCAPCLRELPSLLGLAQRLGPARLALLLVSHPKHWDADKAYLRRARISVPGYTLAPGTSWALRAAAFDITGGSYAVPRSLVLAGRDRRCVLNKEGPEDWASPSMDARLGGWLRHA